jgi:hypothetical protein
VGFDPVEGFVSPFDEFVDCRSMRWIGGYPNTDRHIYRAFVCENDRFVGYGLMEALCQKQSFFSGGIWKEYNKLIPPIPRG